MKKLLLLLFSISTFYIFAHDHHGENKVVLSDVYLEKQIDRYLISFKIHTLEKRPVDFAKINLVVNRKVIASKNIEYITKEKKDYQISFEKGIITSDTDQVLLHVVNVDGYYGNWRTQPIKIDSLPETSTYQYDNVGAYELFADAPWMMKIYNSSGVKNSVPVLLILHDGDGVSYPWIQYADIYIKKSTDAAFGTPLTFNGLTNAQFQALFTNKSTADATLNRKAFDQSLAVKDASHTIAFTESTYFFPSFKYTSVQNFLWYATFNIPASSLSTFTDTDVLDIKVVYTIRITPLSNPITYLRVFRTANNLPSITNWYKGDTHLHSIYTQNTAEQGLPLPATKDAAKLMGIDWIITTDHTSDFDNYGDGNVNNNWSKLGTEVVALNAADPTMMYIRGQEVALKNSIGKLVHFLGYPSYSNPTTAGFLGDGNGDATPTNVTIDNALNSLFLSNGFCYAAHPFATNDELSPLVNGGIWNLGDDDFTINGNNFPQTGGNIICNDPTITSDVLVSNGNDPNKFVKDALKGGQIWNERSSMLTTDSPDDPYNIGGGHTPFAAWPNDLTQHWNRFRQGLEIINFINKKGLLLKNSNDAIQNWKFYLSAGTDAHGSFNYSTTNYVQSFLGNLGGSIQNNAVGKLMTLAYAPTGMGTNGTNILKSMYDGNISISDGPLIVQGFSTDGNNTVNEKFMGDDFIVQTTDTNKLFLNLQYVSSAEYGTITSIDLILGTSSGETTVSYPVTGTSASLSISKIISLFGAANVPMDQYFYIREALSTTKNYGAGSPYILTNETFHALTNPVWIKIKPVSGLPVELLTFDLAEENNMVRLNWKTASEINNKGFEIQRSTDNIHWENIGWADGHATSTIEHSYTFLDEQPFLGENYYRLKQVDFDSTFEYSKILFIYFKSSKELVLYPNPATHILYIHAQQEFKTVNIYNSTGAKVAQRPVNNRMVNLADLASGIYFIGFDDEKDGHRVKIFKN